MEDKLIEVLDDKGGLTGRTELKSVVHRLGLWHKAVHVWVYNSKGDVLMQKRSGHAGAYSGLWDSTVGGHVALGEDIKMAAVNELRNEAGVYSNLDDLEFFKVHKQVLGSPELNMCNKEFVYVYLKKFDGEDKNLKPVEKEVECVNFFPLDRLEKDIRSPERKKLYVPHGEYYFEIFEAVKKRIPR